MTAEDFRDRLARAGIIVRYYNKPRLVDHIRISAGTPEQVDRLLEALRAIAQSTERVLNLRRSRQVTTLASE